MWRTKDSACLKAETLAMVGRGDVSAASTVGLRNKSGRPGGPQVQPGWGGPTWYLSWGSGVRCIG